MAITLSKRDLRILSIVFCSAMEHDWNEWFDGANGMTGETEEDCETLYEKLYPIFEQAGEEGLKKYLKKTNRKFKLNDL